MAKVYSTGQRAAFLLLVLSGVLCFALAVCYQLRLDSCAAVTIFPVWMWTPVGFLLAVPALSVKRKHSAALAVSCILLWTAFTLYFSKEPRSLVRRPLLSEVEFQAVRQSGKGIRVASINCSAGNAHAVSEAKIYNPDIVLLQETPSESDVARLARELFGDEAGYACNIDTSIIARGRVSAHRLRTDLSSNCTFARVRLASGCEVMVVSLRLVPPVFRLDLWSADCWREQTANRSYRSDQVERIAEELRCLPGGTPVILGGDFNAPAGDAIYRLLPAELHDTFTERGVGWGNTVLNGWAVQRIDQIWVTRHFRTVKTNSRKTRHSDHRLVVCDLIRNGESK